MSSGTPDGEVGGKVLACLLGRLLRQHATGTLMVQQGESVSRAFFREGVLAGAQVFGRFKPLGISFLENGDIDIETLNASLEVMAKAKVPQGQVLVDLGAVTVEQLKEGLHEQQLANVAAFLALDSGTWIFDPGLEPPPWTSEICIEPEVAVLAACREPTGEPIIRTALQDLDSTRVKLLVEAAVVVERFALTAGEARVLRGFDGEADVDAIAVAGGVELVDLLALIAALYCFDLVAPLTSMGKVLELLPEQAPEEPPAPAPEPAPAAPVSAPAAPAPGLSQVSSRSTADAFADADSLGLAPVTRKTKKKPKARPVAPPSPPAPPPKAEAPEAPKVPASAKKPGGGTPIGKTGPKRGEAGGEKKRRSRLFQKAIQNIPGAEKMAAAQAAKEAAKEVAAQSKVERVSDSGSEEDKARLSKERKSKMASRRQSEESRTFAAEVRKWHEQVKGEDFYRRLRIKRTAATGQVKAGYLTLAKRFHPDRASALDLDADLAGKLHVVFEAIKEAYDTLKDAKERERYDAQLKAGVTDAGEDRSRLIAAAQMQFRKGVVAFKKKDFQVALPLMRQAYKADPKNGEWAVHYAWAMYGVGPVEEVRDKVLLVLKKAAGTDEGGARAFYYLGLIARMEGELDRAELYLTKALQKNEKLTEATTELRLIKRRMERVGGNSTRRLMRKILGD